MTAAEARAVVRALGWSAICVRERGLPEGSWAYAPWVKYNGKRNQIIVDQSLCNAIRVHDAMVRHLGLGDRSLLCPL